MTTEITVRGSFEHFCAPERGTVHATVSFEGPAIQPVFERTVRALDLVRSTVQPLHDPGQGPVTWWNTQEIRTWANRPWNKDGKRLPLVHHASVGLEVKFRDFAVLSRWLSGHVEGTEGFTLGRVVWALTEARRVELEQDARTRAVRDARTRAQHYADALELGPLRPVALADTGMLGTGTGPGEGPVAFARGAAAGAGGSDPDLVPADVKVRADVEARFTTG
ncbi:SIMPL domain-containing protein [Nocardioides sambongensis]|uniref:SIMPL domain-containing protein n=1 Tax=Nocardioides sambongensis TaxID=2589074 RepID=UPI00112AEAD4|nr:SIMPL domain-containing protein [Nocardioides sambongensis]